jgi:hypothetical protein
MKFWIFRRIADLEWKAEQARIAINGIEDILRARPALKLEPSPRPRQFSAPQCRGMFKTNKGVDKQCWNHTKDESGYCKTHRSLLVGSNGIPIVAVPEPPA